MTITKEKNFLFITTDDGKTYRYDINTATLYGLKGTPIKTQPKGFVSYVDRNFLGNSFLLSYIRNTIYWRYYNLFTMPTDIMVLYDRIDSLGIPYNYSTSHLTNEIKTDKDFKNLILYLKDHSAIEFTVKDYTSWVREKEAQELLKDYYSIMPENMREYILQYISRDYIEKYLDTIFYYVFRGKLYEFNNLVGGSTGHILNDYFQMCETIEKKPEKVNNLMREYVETYNYYQLKKTEYDNKSIANNYAKHLKAWDFTYGNYTIVIPTCGQDLVEEGQNMHHCVGGYVENIVKGTSYIIFVRHKDTPDKCYITAEIDTAGNICQYYLAHDRCISSTEDETFKAELQKHLNNMWDK